MSQWLEKESGREGLRCDLGAEAQGAAAAEGLHRDLSLCSRLPASPCEQAPPRPAGEAAEEAGPGWARHLGPQQRRRGVLTPGPVGNFQGSL